MVPATPPYDLRDRSSHPRASRAWGPAAWGPQSPIRTGSDTSGLCGDYAPERVEPMPFDAFLKVDGLEGEPEIEVVEVRYPAPVA